MKRTTRYEKIDYEDLEGKVIDWIGGGLAVKAVVAGCNRDVGITLKCTKHYPCTDDYIELKKGQELSCLNGPSSPHPESRYYNAIFRASVNMLERGFYSPTLIRRIENNFKPSKQHGRYAMTSCAFGA